MFLELFLFAKKMKFSRLKMGGFRISGERLHPNKKLSYGTLETVNLNKVVMEAYSIRNDWLKKYREGDTTSGNPLERHALDICLCSHTH